MGVSYEKLLDMAQMHASDVLKRRWPNRYQGRPVLSQKDCLKGLIEIGAISRETVELTSKDAAMCHWFVGLLGGKEKNKSSSNSMFYKSSAWRKLRFSVLAASGAYCCACGASAKDGAKLHVDHIKPRSKYPELALEPSNLQVLCEDCNLGKSDGEAVSFL